MGSGLSTEITNISYSAPTYTVTIADNVNYTSNTNNTVSVSKWSVLPKVNGDYDQYKVLNLFTNNKDIMIQLKVVMQWSKDNEFYSMSIINDTEQHAK